jgi:hypothetical protein
VTVAAVVVVVAVVAVSESSGRKIVREPSGESTTPNLILSWGPVK